MNTGRFRTEGGGLLAALTRKVYYTAKTIHATDGSRSAISTGPTNGSVLCQDPIAHEANTANYTINGTPGVGEIVTRCQDDAQVDNRAMVVGFAVGLRGSQDAAGWIDVVPPVKGTPFNPIVKANANIATPTYLKPVTGVWSLQTADMSGSTPADEPIALAVAMETADTSTTEARKPVHFI